MEERLGSKAGTSRPRQSTQGSQRDQMRSLPVSMIGVDFDRRSADGELHEVVGGVGDDYGGDGGRRRFGAVVEFDGEVE